MMNTALDVLLVVFIFLFTFHLTTYSVDYKEEFVHMLRVFIFLFGWSIILLTVASVLVEIGFSIAGNRFYFWRTLWAVIRLALSAALLFSVYFIEYFLNDNLKIMV